MSAIPGDFGRRMKCVCCNNPWNLGDSESFFACTPCLTDNKGYAGLDPANFDSTVLAKDNFYKWSNGGWMSRNPIPSDYSSWNTFIALRDLNLERIKEIVEGFKSNEASLTGDLVKLRDFYHAFMNEEEVETAGITPLLPAFELCSNVKVQ